MQNCHINLKKFRG